MAKKTTGTRLNKKEVRNRLLVVFEHSAGATYNVKSLFRAVGAVNHPAKMLVLDTLADLVADDFLTTDGTGHYRHAERDVQSSKGCFAASETATTCSFPTTAARTFSSPNATHTTPSTATMCG